VQNQHKPFASRSDSVGFNFCRLLIFVHSFPFIPWVPAARHGKACEAEFGSARLNRASAGGNPMQAGDQTGAAILVQTIFLRDGHLQGLLGEQASKGPEAAVEFLKPYYVAALAMTVRAKPEQES
jgi:hypothetical protein